MKKPYAFSKGTLVQLVLLLICFTAQAQQPGSLDLSFNASGVKNNFGQGTLIPQINESIVQPDGKILISGNFTTCDSSYCNLITRLNTDGSIDTTFLNGVNLNERLHTIALQPDGKILLGGDFTTFGSTARNRIARLNADGTLDTSFDPGSGLNNDVFTIAVQPDGKIIIGGNFTSYNGIPSNAIARLYSDGSLDTSFVADPGLEAKVYTVALQADGKILAGGIFTFHSGSKTYNYFARLNANGSADSTFHNGLGIKIPGDSTCNTMGFVRDIIIQPDQKILIGGDICWFDSIKKRSILRLFPDGNLDTAFTTIVAGKVEDISLQPNGKILIGGFIGSMTSQPINAFTRLNTDGSFDSTFLQGLVYQNGVATISVQQDGNVIIAGFFSEYDSVTRLGIARILVADAFAGVINAAPETETARLTLYPNPAAGSFMVDFSDEKNVGPAVAEVFTNLGQHVCTKLLPGGETRPVDLSGLPNGSYFIRIIISGRHFMQPVILSR